VAERDFVYIAHEAPTEAGFSVEDLPGTGRLDLLCRCVNAALLTSHGVRENTEAHLVLRNDDGKDVTVRFEGEDLHGINPDERSIAGVVRATLNELTYYEVETSPGVYVAERSVAEVLEATDGETVVLDENGESLERPPDSPTFVLSDHLDFTDEDLGALGDARRVSLGPVALHADHATAVAQNRCDTDVW
jgi:tRNA (pseudouridine54-N1)-methyltransferase